LAYIIELKLIKMKVEQIYTGCLAEAAYYIESNGEVAIIDPLREVDAYLQRAEKDEAKIKYIFETHFHADFVSGHVDLALRANAEIVYGPTAKTDFKSHIAADGEVFQLGDITITALHTPGHTPESTTYLLKDQSGKPYCIFSGDTLFIGDVGRPDLAQQGSLTVEDMAGTLYDSLHAKILTLPDEVLVYPAHGAGSACGKNMSKETFDTLGNQKQVNYALKAADRATFIKEVTDGILPPPQYFAKNAAINKAGYERFEQVLEKGFKPLDPDAFGALANQTSALILDVRDPQVFAAGFIPSSVNIGLGGQFAPWVGSLITDIKQPILLVCEADKVEEAITRLTRVGYDYAIGYLEGGINAWLASGREVDTIDSISAADFETVVAENPEVNVLDVRKPGEYESEHLEMTLARPLDYINDWTNEIHPKETYYIHCAGGYRSMIAASILKARGVENVVDIAGGYGALKNTGLKRTDFACASKAMKTN
jgi:hydroxyacylglutathione hydrolase